MDFSSLRQYPMPPGLRTAWWPSKLVRHSARWERIILGLALVVAIVALTSWLRRAAKALDLPPPPPRPPLDFKLVKERYSQLRSLATREQVHELLGPPSTPTGVWQRDLAEWESSAEWSHRHLGIPADRFWELWTDPDDPGTGVAILFADYKIYHIGRRGF